MNVLTAHKNTTFSGKSRVSKFERFTLKTSVTNPRYGSLGIIVFYVRILKKS